MRPLGKKKQNIALLMPVLKIQVILLQLTNLIMCNLAFFSSRKEMDSRWEYSELQNKGEEENRTV